MYCKFKAQTHTASNCCLIFFLIPILCPKTLLWFCNTEENWSLYRNLPTGYNARIPKKYSSYPVLGLFSHRCWTSPSFDEEAAQGSSSNCGRDSLWQSTTSFYKNRWIEMEIASAFRGEELGEEWWCKISMLEGWNRESKVQLKWYGLYRIHHVKRRRKRKIWLETVKRHKRCKRKSREHWMIRK